MPAEKAVPLTKDEEVNVTVDGIQPGLVAKRSHTCCGCCCDTRTATIVVNLISITFALLNVISIITVTSDRFVDNLDDDSVKQDISAIDKSVVGVGIAMAVSGIIAYGLGIYGAYKFVRWPVLVAAAWYVVEIIFSFVVLSLFGVVICGFFLYPHIIFIQELNKGIMRPETYSQESHCCCNV